jgi:hypothetical protein
MKKRKPNKGSFKKGRKKSPNSGRKKGQTVVTISVLREVCLQAMEELGDNDMGRNGALGYIKRFAQEQRKTFMGSIVARLIPQQVRAEVIHALDTDAAIAAIEHSINGLLAARRAKDVTPQHVAGSVGDVQEDVAILVAPRTNGSSG